MHVTAGVACCKYWTQRETQLQEETWGLIETPLSLGFEFFLLCFSEREMLHLPKILSKINFSNYICVTILCRHQ
jgi:hypothetical protein